jgi:hypothetical protein
MCVDLYESAPLSPATQTGHRNSSFKFLQKIFLNLGLVPIAYGKKCGNGLAQPLGTKFSKVCYSQLAGWTLLPIPIDDNDIDESPHCNEISTT